MNLHKLYLSLFASAVVLTAIAGSAWRDHVRDDAQRDAVLATQRSDIAGLQQRIADARNDAEMQIAAIEREKQALSAAPGRAPRIIRELITPAVKPVMAEASKPAAAEDPSISFNKQQQIDLAQFALTCKECSAQRDQLALETKDEQEIIARQKVELDAEKKAAKGGSFWQRTRRIAKWVAISGAVGYVIGREQR